MTRTVRRVAVDRGRASAHLPGWDFADAYEVALSGPSPDSARTAADCLFDLSAIGRVTLRARDALVRVASLKPAVREPDQLFPVLYVTAELAVLGLDDRHLDFRVLVSVAPGHIGCTTAVRRHNALGYAYLAVVTPFHRAAVPQLLARADRRGWRPHPAGAAAAPAGQPTRAGEQIGTAGGVIEGGSRGNAPTLFGSAGDVLVAAVDDGPHGRWKDHHG